MKKHLFWLAVSAAALTACTSTEVTEEGIQSNAIGFENAISKHNRAEVTGDVTSAYFDLFSVYGYYTKTNQEAHPVTVFNGDLVTKDGNGNWGYDNTRYWVPEAKYYFYAYSCADIELVEEKGKPYFNMEGDDEGERALKINDYICNATHQHDLLCSSAKADGQISNNTKVSFNFSHALCKVSAEFINAFPEGYDIYISNVKIKNFYDKANYDIAADKWSGEKKTDENTKIDMVLASQKEDDEEEVIDKATHDKSVLVAPVYMLPVTYATTVTLEFTISVKQGDQEFLNRVIKGSWTPSWEPGHAYKYTVNLNGENAKLEAIVFEATQKIKDNDTWEDKTPVEFTFEM